MMNENQKEYLFYNSSHNKIIAKDLSNFGFYNINDIQFNNKDLISKDIGLSFSALITIDDISNIIDIYSDENLSNFIELNIDLEDSIKTKKDLLIRINDFKNNVVTGFKNFFNNPNDMVIEKDLKYYNSFSIYEDDSELIEKFSKEKIIVKYYDEQFIVSNDDKKTNEIIVNFLRNFIYSISSNIFIDCTTQEILDQETRIAKRKQELELNLFSNTIYKQKIINDVINDYNNSK